MPEMSRPHLPTPDHAGHDVLLVAQLAAGDPLPADERGRAMALVGSCADCASLAADLGAVSRAVAAEVAPRRTRDYRIDASQAADLRGWVRQRFLRQVSLPE